MAGTGTTKPNSSTGALPTKTDGDPCEPPSVRQFSSAYGIRTRVCALRGHYPGPLDECAMSYHHSTAQRLESVCANRQLVKRGKVQSRPNLPAVLSSPSAGSQQIPPPGSRP